MSSSLCKGCLRSLALESWGSVMSAERQGISSHYEQSWRGSFLGCALCPLCWSCDVLLFVCGAFGWMYRRQRWRTDDLRSFMSFMQEQHEVAQFSSGQDGQMLWWGQRLFMAQRFLGDFNNAIQCSDSHYPVGHFHSFSSKKVAIELKCADVLFCISLVFP